MNRYEAMFIMSPELTDDEKKVTYAHISDAITKSGGTVGNAALWADRKKLCFPIKKHAEGAYYLVNFTVEPAGIKDIRHAYQLNENILRVLITKAK